MAQNITLMGASYSAVPAVTLPKTGGGTARFDDATVTTATASDVASGKVFVAADGTITTGTGSGGDDSLIVTLSWDDDYFGVDEGAWVPDCTIYELQAAYTGGKNIAFVGEDGQVVEWFYDDDYVFIYGIYIVGDQPNTTLIKQYLFTVDGIEHIGTETLVYPFFDSPTRTYTPTTSQQTETITFDPSTYNGIQQVGVTVNAMPSGTAGTPTATKGAVSNHSVNVTPSVTNVTGYITGGTKTGTAVSVTASELVSGSETKTANGTYDVTNLAELVVNVSGGSGDLMIATATSTPATASHAITFTGLSGEPTSFHIVCQEDLATASQVKVAAVAYDGTDHTGQTVTNTSNAQASFDDGFSHAYSNGTLTVTATTAYFQAEEYALCYTYGGGSANIGTKDVQVGSGATSITFTGLPDEPSCWSCVFTSNFSTSSGYQRVMAVANDGTGTYGLEMDSGAHHSDQHWTSSYSNGSLTITSQGTNAGGYFHQPGNYHLTYAVGGKVDVTVEALTVTQNGTYSESGKAYSPVTVNVSGGGSVQFDTKTATASDYPTSLQFTSMKGEPKAFVLRLNAQVSSSGSTTYYYIVDISAFGTTTHGNCFRIGSTRRVDNITSGYSWSYSGTTLTITSSAASRSASPGAFYNGSYELLYAY